MSCRVTEDAEPCPTCGHYREHSEYTCDECGKVSAGKDAYRGFIDVEWYNPSDDPDEVTKWKDADLCSWSCLAAFAEKKVSA